MKKHKNIKNPMQNSKKTRLVALCATFFVLLFLFCIPCLGQNGEDGVPDEKSILDALRENLPEMVADSEDMADISAVSEMIGLPHVIRVCLQGARGSALPSLKLCAVLCGLMILGGICSACFDGIPSEGIKKTASVCIAASCALSAYFQVSLPIERAFTALGDMSRFSMAVFPTAAAISYAGGNMGVAVTQQTSVTLILSLCESLASGVLAPMIRACFAFALIASFSESSGASAIAKSMRNMYLILLSLMAAVATASLSVQTAMAASADSAALRTARFAVGQMIPVVGTAVSSTLGTLSSSLSVLRDLLGGGSIAVLLISVIPVVAELYLGSLALNAAGALASVVGFEDGKRICGDLKGIFDMMLATVALVTALFIVMFAVFMRTAFAVS